jgi:hypothetical protein
MKDFRPEFFAMLNGEHTSAAILVALKFVHVSSGTIVQIVDNTEDISINGDLFVACGFDLSPPQDKEEDVRSAKVTINNADQFMTSFVRGLSGNVTAEIIIVTPSNLSTEPKQFNNIEYQWLPIRVTSIQYNSSTIEMTLIMDPLSLKQFPSVVYDPYNFPGLFA